MRKRTGEEEDGCEKEERGQGGRETGRLRERVRIMDEKNAVKEI